MNARTLGSATLSATEACFNSSLCPHSNPKMTGSGASFDAWRSDEQLNVTYSIESAQLLGRGKFSVVHRTTRIADGRAVALKRIQVFDMGTTKRDECMNEIKLLQSMDHPHIIAYLDCVIEHNELTVVMELAEHGDLAGLIKAAFRAKQPLSEAEVWRYFSQIANALAYMHKERVMHRDIKPANVFVLAANHVKLGDLGVGRHFSSKTDMVHSTVGTPYYMSPECIHGKTGYDFKSDLWSMGCLLYELATLRSPFYSDKVNFYVLGKRITSCKYDPVGDAYSPELTGLVGNMLQSSPTERPTAADVFERSRAQLELRAGSAGAAPKE